MKINRIDHAGIVVDDLSAMKTFFTEFGLELLGEDDVEGQWVERIIGLEDVKVEVAMLGTPDGEANIELVKFHSPVSNTDARHSVANMHGIRHLAFAVEDIEALVKKLEQHGAELVGEIVTYENMYKLCYVRAPEGIILELAEQLEQNGEI